jgi:hypothetical protein
MIDWLWQEYESIFEDELGQMTVSRSRVHKYLGMALDYTICVQVNISIFNYIDEIIDAFDKAEPKGGGTKSSATPDDLFKVDKDCEKLPPEKAFLMTRVQAPDKDDWNKLVHLMKYLRGMRTLPLILSANGTCILKWWVDAAFAVHPIMQGHSGGGLSLGRTGFPIVSYTKQRLNTQSSTESEIMGADDFMPGICWTQYFMEAQGYQVQDNVLFQDNKSTSLLEKNGKASSSKHMKHVNIRYFFITVTSSMYHWSGVQLKT